jgi:hypothetical protein
MPTSFLEQLNHLPWAGDFPVALLQALPKKVITFRPAPLPAPLFQRSRSSQSSRLPFQDIQIMLQIENHLPPAVTTFMTGNALSSCQASIELANTTTRTFVPAFTGTE